MSQFKQIWMLHFGQIFTFVDKNRRYIFIGYDGRQFTYKSQDNGNIYGKLLSEKTTMVHDRGQNYMLTNKQINTNNISIYGH